MSRKPSGASIFGVALLSLVLAFAIVVFASSLVVERYSSCTIVDKEIVAATERGPARGVVWTDRCGEFIVQDSVLLSKRSAKVIWRSLEVGKKYDIAARGWRIPGKGFEPNVMSVKEVE